MDGRMVPGPLSSLLFHCVQVGSSVLTKTGANIKQVYRHCRKARHIWTQHPLTEAGIRIQIPDGLYKPSPGE